jgi:tripartite-type tricarboxylate transporter receptor subunit TctC
MAPAATPDAITAKVRAGLERVIADPTVRARLEGAGVEPAWNGDPRRVAEALAADRKKWSDLAKRAGIESPN